MTDSARLRPEADADALTAWVRRHQAPTWRFLRLCGCAADLADDLVQEAMLAALHKNVHRLDDVGAAAWLRGAASNLWRMQLRGDARRVARSARALAEQARRQCERDDGGEAWLAALRACLQGLDGRAREVLDRHYAGGITLQSVAAAMGLRPEGVKTLLRRVRGLLRECVLRRLGGEHGARP